MMNTQELLQILACPRCMGSLEPLPSAAPVTEDAN